MECLYCKGEMERSTAPFSITRKGYHLFWEAVPAWVCTQCGEAYFEEHEVDLMQKAAEAVDHETMELQATVS